MFPVEVYGGSYRKLSAPISLIPEPKKLMISHPRIASCFKWERARVRSEPAETTLTFYSLPPKRLCYHGGNSVFISVVSFRTEAVTVFWSFALFLIFFIFSSAG